MSDDKLAEIVELIKLAIEYIEQLPSGIDIEADPNNETPEDACAHLGGLAWKAMNKALKEIP